MKHQDRIFQYRCTKDGEEMFISGSRKEFWVKVAELRDKYPDARITTQTRYVPTNKHGAPLLLPNGEPQWSTWA